MLARRELSAAQIRQRLARRGHETTSIDAAIARLTAAGSLDDTRVAGIIARAEAVGKTRGRSRVLRAIQAAGIAPAVARRAVDETFEQIDAGAHLAASLDRRLKGRTIADEAEFRRLYRYLVAQGFDADRVLNLLERRRRESS